MIADACTPPPVEWPDCQTDMAFDVCDMAVWNHAAALLEAARCIANEGLCPAAHRCDDGTWKLGGDDTAPIAAGSPAVDDGCCCGSIVVTYRLPTFLDRDQGCDLRVGDVEFDVTVTWPCGTHEFVVAAEQARFFRLLEEVACCKAAAFDDPKEGCQRRPRMVGVADYEASDCPGVTYRFEIETR